MKAITLHQPWATLVALGAKQYETRSWGTDYRGPLVIHAGKNQETLENLAAYYRRERETEEPLESWLNRVTPSSELALAYYFREVIRASEEIKHRHDRFTLANLPRGAAIALVDLVDVVCEVGEISAQERAFGCFDEGRYFWKLENVRMLKTPIYTRGYQNLWNCSIDLIKHINSDLGLCPHDYGYTQDGLMICSVCGEVLGPIGS